MRGDGVECVLVDVVHIEREGDYFWGNMREIKALFVLRGIGEWVQLVPAAVM